MPAIRFPARKFDTAFFAMRESGVTYPLYLPVTDVQEAESLLQELPIAVDKEHFSNFVLGFPRKYLVSTPRIEIVKHYLLMEGLGHQSVISSLSQDGQLWKLCLVSRDRKFLFSRFAGTLSYFGMNIVSAEAFANANSLVLDTFYFSDPANYFSQGNHKQQFQHFLEDVVQGKTQLEPLLSKRWDQVMLSKDEPLSVQFDNDSHPSTTRLTLDCHDHFGLLYLVSRCISEEGHNIEMAYIETPGHRVHDEFYITFEGSKLSPSQQQDLKTQLTHLGARYFRQEIL